MIDRRNTNRKCDPLHVYFFVLTYGVTIDIICNKNVENYKYQGFVVVSNYSTPKTFYLINRHAIFN